MLVLFQARGWQECELSDHTQSCHFDGTEQYFMFCSEYKLSRFVPPPPSLQRQPVPVWFACFAPPAVVCGACLDVTFTHCGILWVVDGMCLVCPHLLVKVRLLLFPLPLARDHLREDRVTRPRGRDATHLVTMDGGERATANPDHLCT